MNDKEKNLWRMIYILWHINTILLAITAFVAISAHHELGVMSDQINNLTHVTSTNVDAINIIGENVAALRDGIVTLNENTLSVRETLGELIVVYEDYLVFLQDLMNRWPLR